MADLSREEFMAWMETLHAATRAVQTSVDLINGRLRETEQRVAVLQDRAGPSRAAMWGGGTSGLVIAVMEGLKWALNLNK